MKSKIASFIMTILVILIISILILLGIFVYQEIYNEDSNQIEEFVSTYNPTSENSVEDTKKITTPQLIKDKISKIEEDRISENKIEDTSEIITYKNLKFNDYEEECAVKLLRITVPKNHEWVGKPIRCVEFPQKSLAVLIKRKQERIIPKNSTVIQAGDNITLSLPAINLPDEL